MRALNERTYKSVFLFMCLCRRTSVSSSVSSIVLASVEAVYCYCCSCIYLGFVCFCAESSIGTFQNDLIDQIELCYDSFIIYRNIYRANKNYEQRIMLIENFSYFLSLGNCAKTLEIARITFISWSQSLVFPRCKWTKWLWYCYTVTKKIARNCEKMRVATNKCDKT